ncbi:MAG: OmpA family protein [Bacteroidetes bacterium]|nr:OmpA family protein [Bacteroidota bacterium]MDA0888850.1 OmpA family protein [Bacteroidota bacterium]MDA1084723.1 OmpA family protein [Bacteroidota bacterium]
MKNYLFTALMLVSFTTSVLAQNDTNPWKLTVGTNAVNLLLDGKDNETQISPNFSYLEVSRYIGSGFSVDLAGTLNNLSRESGSDDLYYSLDLGTSLSANQIINLGKFEPTLRVGVGLAGGLSGISPLSDDFFVTYAGAGLNYWFSDAFALTLKTTYKVYSREFDGLIGNDDGGITHLQHLAGFSFAFGDGDTDRDGVKDSLDACPEVAGLENLNGCPDDDGDGIRNSDDDCPLTAGLAALNGCPDADNDSIKDSDDACPNVAGVAALNGCPDADGDGITDADDACPNAAGSEALNGCPDADGDSVADKDDKCPAVAGPASNNGCPEYPLSMLADYDITFDLEKYNIDSQDVERLSTVLKVLLANSDASISIEGHADNTGEESFNNPLSNNRASSIKDYLVNLGIDANRLSTKAFGESMPKASNKTAEGRAINRRVEFKVVN